MLSLPGFTLQLEHTSLSTQQDSNALTVSTDYGVYPKAWYIFKRRVHQQSHTAYISSLLERYGHLVNMLRRKVQRPALQQPPRVHLLARQSVDGLVSARHFAN